MGVHEDKLTSFEYALRNAGIGRNKPSAHLQYIPAWRKAHISRRWLEINKTRTDTFHDIF